MSGTPPLRETTVEGYAPMSYACKLFPRYLQIQCTWYYFEERIEAILRYYNLRLHFEDKSSRSFYKACTRDGPHCVSAAGKILFADLWFSNVTIPNCTLGVLTCWCSLFVDTQAQVVQLHETWLACVHGSMSYKLQSWYADRPFVVNDFCRKMLQGVDDTAPFPSDVLYMCIHTIPALSMKIHDVKQEFHGAFAYTARNLNRSAWNLDDEV